MREQEKGFIDWGSADISNRHRWIPEQKEWVMDTGSQLMIAGKASRSDKSANLAAIPHVPRSVQADSKPKAGLRNLRRVLWS